ncbi:MAG TPA: glycosyltransferase family 2 protein [Candidatus Dormibacteraeota bacterium]|nr:glycosyltransferase family 2 protein [Candidatus Dormibacteraeota bacterium]
MREPMSPPAAVTVITVVRNGAATIASAVESVLAQSHPPLEHVIVDGGSTDGTLEILHGFGDRVRWISEPDRGLYDAMNKGLSLIRDPDRYVIFLNADDSFHAPDAIAHALALSDREDFLYGRLERLDEEFGDRDVIGGPVAARDLLFGMRAHHQTILARKRVFDTIGGFRIEYRIAADYDWVVRAFQSREITRRFVPVVVTTMRRGGVSERGYLAGIAERRRIVRAAYSRADQLRFLVYSVYGDYGRWGLLHVLRSLGLLPLARRLKRSIGAPSRA